MDIAAWTESGIPAEGYVRYVNFTRNDDGSVSVTVRNTDCTTVAIAVPAADWSTVVQSIGAELAARPTS